MLLVSVTAVPYQSHADIPVKPGLGLHVHLTTSVVTKGRGMIMVEMSKSIIISSCLRLLKNPAGKRDTIKFIRLSCPLFRQHSTK